MIIRQIGFGILAVLAIAVTFGLQPEESEPINTERFDRQVQQALADFDANEFQTAGAPELPVAQALQIRAGSWGDRGEPGQVRLARAKQHASEIVTGRGQV